MQSAVRKQSKVFKTPIAFIPPFPLAQVQSWVKHCVVVHAHRIPLWYHFLLFLLPATTVIYSLAVLSLPTQAPILIVRSLNMYTSL